LPLAQVVTRLGQQHWEEGSEARQRYVTAIFVRLDAVNATLEVVNAGHNPALLLSAEKRIEMIEASAPPLGMLPGMSYRAETFPFPAEARLLLYTDGLTEVFCGEDEFGCERLTETFREAASSDAPAILDLVWSALAKFASQESQTDDMTALAVCHVAGSQQETEPR
jgi:serine phosphatase RsbU (regulator of sigma subunit)